MTGIPGVGKTTVLLKTVESLKAKGHSVGGMLSREARSEGIRVGFEVTDLNSGRHGWLAHVNQPTGPSVGRYRVNLSDLENVGVDAILKAVEFCDVIAVDEIGPMELFSSKFKEAVKRAVESGKVLVGVVHWKARDELIGEVRKREDAEIFEIAYQNRDILHKTIVEKALEFLKQTNQTQSFPHKNQCKQD